MKHLVIAIICAAAAFAQPSAARIDVNGVSTKVMFTNMSMTGSGYTAFASWYKESSERASYITGNFTIASNAWVTVALTFTPLASGVVILSFGGPWYKPQDAEKNILVPVIWDSITAVGADIKNGSFEQIDMEKNAPADWELQGDKEKAKVVSGRAQAGSFCVVTDHDNRFFQRISVKENVPVTIKAFAFCAAP